MTSSCWQHCRFAVFACQKWWTVLFSRIDSWGLCLVCCWARCWMLEDMDNMEASCIFYVKVGTFNYLEQSKICCLTINKIRIVRRTVQLDTVFAVSVKLYPMDYLRHTATDILSLEQCPNYISQSWDFGCCTPQCISVHKQTTSAQPIAHSGTMANPCKLHPYIAGFILGITYKLAAIYSIPTWS